MITKRLAKLQSSLKNPILIKKKENLFYLTGQSFDYRSEEYLLVNPKGQINKDKRQLSTDVVGFGSGLEKINWVKKADRLKNIGKYVGGKNLDIEYGFTYGEGIYIRKKGLGIRVKPGRSAVDVMRVVKEPNEIALVKKSMQIVEKVFVLVRKEIKKQGMTEIKLAKFIQSAGFKMGAEDISFPAIVACGANAAIPHHVPGAKKIKPNESIIIDFGFKFKNYCSDFTRTVFLKSAPQKLAKAYNQVEKAYKECIEFSKPGALAGKVYQKSVDILEQQNLGRYFIHSLGHGTGLEIHELPNLSPNSTDPLKDGMVFSIEPGVYFPRLGGIRIEDLVYLEGGVVKKFINVSTELQNNIL